MAVRLALTSISMSAAINLADFAGRAALDADLMAPAPVDADRRD